MPVNQFLNTPEALLGRNDSKNPATTCKGITSTGRPCRRALALHKNVSSNIEDSSIGGVIALLKQDARIADAQFYCWQHKDQAADVVRVTDHDPRSDRQTEILELKNRSSIDTLVQRLGIQSLDDEPTEDRRTRHTRRPSTRPVNSSKPSAQLDHRPHRTHRQPATTPPNTSFWASLCCMSAGDSNDTLEVVRRRRRLEESTPGRTITSPVKAKSVIQDSSPGSSQAYNNLPLRLIPQDTSPQIAGKLLAELSKPFSVHDEDGYIYIFWLTPSDQRDPGETTARALLAPATDRHRRISDVMTESSYSADDQPLQPSQKTILLKIGRANNVTRRMNEWQRQCGHRLNLVRWYPYTSTSSTPLPSPEKAPSAQPLYPDLSQHGRPAASRRVSSNVRKVSNVKRVERLIHLELSDQQSKQLCEACGREHREWFKVEASESGIRKVDSIVRRWVEWSEHAS